MRLALLLLLVIHGLIHVMGFVRAFEFAPVQALAKPIAPAWGIAWLTGALLLLGAAALWSLRSPAWVWSAALGVILSQILIASAWGEAKWGTLANLVIALPVVLALLDKRAGSFTSQFQTEVARRSAAISAQPSALIKEEDLLALPAPIQRYMKRVGAVGQPRVFTARAHFLGRMRKAPDQAWMDVDVQQFNSFGPEPARLFLLNASQFGVPVDVFHRYADGGAQMSVRALGLIPLVHVFGPEMTQAETVTVLNDLFLLAPGALLGANIRWQELSPTSVRATYTQGPHTISAVISVDADGYVADFASEDRYQSDEHGHHLVRWSTPMRDYKDFGAWQLPAYGEARWGDVGAEWTYAEFRLQSVTFNVAP